MANISAAYGDLTIIADTPEDIKWLRQFINKRLGSVYYSTQLFFSDNEEIRKLTNDKYEFNCQFDGTGRWTYRTNVENFGRWLKEECSPEDLKHINSLEFKLIFNYRDEEGGCCELYEAIYELTHKKDTDIEDIVVNNTYNKEYEYTGENLALLDFIDSAEDWNDENDDDEEDDEDDDE